MFPLRNIIIGLYSQSQWSTEGTILTEAEEWRFNLTETEGCFLAEASITAQTNPLNWELAKNKDLTS